MQTRTGAQDALKAALLFYFIFLGDVFRAFYYLTVKVKHAYECMSKTTEDYCYHYI